ncbi:hypothetical protein [Kribbella sp. NPDC006257]|uniref:hypothetical protein n=1 Tax=Kribbella sp. NPDC006257 TaxID=3156738 RepID=UPI0033B78AD9
MSEAAGTPAASNHANTLSKFPFNTMRSPAEPPYPQTTSAALFLMVDPRWDLPYDDARTALVLRQCVHLTQSFVEASYETVLIAGNAIYDAIDLNPVIPTSYAWAASSTSP